MPLVVASVSMIDAFVSLICAGWLPQDGSVSAGERSMQV
jgi:hypothetical protein